MPGRNIGKVDLKSLTHVKTTARLRHFPSIGLDFYEAKWTIEVKE